MSPRPSLPVTGKPSEEDLSDVLGGRPPHGETQSQRTGTEMGGGAFKGPLP